jgi:hypothetical protein
MLLAAEVRRLFEWFDEHLPGYFEDAEAERAAAADEF